jgi:hypothetical protein
VITGFNTDIKFGGVTYHVQTEDKGVKTPLILSLVYVGGTIIASKRTPYADLVETGYDEGALTERLQRQHKLICAAIRAGRVEELKKMSEPGARQAPGGKKGKAGSNGAAKKAPAVEEAPADAAAGEAAGENAQAAANTPESAAPTAPEPAPASAPAETVAEEVLKKAAAREVAEAAPARKSAPAPEPKATPPPAPQPQPPPAPEPPAAAEELLNVVPVEVLEPDDDRLYLNLLDDEGEFRAGQLATIKVQVGRGAYGQRAAADASVTIKVLGTSFRPLVLSTRTDRDGVAVVRALLPRFTSGRAAIIIRAAAGPDVAELRRIIHQY